VSRLRRPLLIVAAAVVLGVVALLAMIPRPAALPPEATALALPTQPWKPWPLGGFGCPMGLVAPSRVERDGDVVVFSGVDVPERIGLIWPSGFSARLLEARAELVAPDGSVLAREGDVISNLAGGAADDGTILICFDFASKPTVEPPT